jgi:hypothetical protein
MPTIVSLHGRGGAVVPPHDRLLPRLSVCKKVLKRTLPEISGKKKASARACNSVIRLSLAKAPYECGSFAFFQCPIRMRKLCVFSPCVPPTQAALHFAPVKLCMLG